MKITKKNLEKIIKEELNKILQEQKGPTVQDYYDSELSKAREKVFKQQFRRDPDFTKGDNRARIFDLPEGEFIRSILSGKKQIKDLSDQELGQAVRIMKDVLEREKRKGPTALKAKLEPKYREAVKLFRYNKRE